MLNERFLYRAKHKTNAVWEVGSLVILPNGDYEIANKCANPPDSDPMWEKCVITHMVDPSTICQCTGLHDSTRWEELTCEEQRQFLLEWNFKKNRRNAKEDWTGRRVFEKDIVSLVFDGKSYVYQVVWDESELDYKATNGEENYKNNFQYLLCCEDIKVLGNGFDNPELVEQLDGRCEK